jgi:hypothetical protein
MIDEDTALLSSIKGTYKEFNRKWCDRREVEIFRLKVLGVSDSEQCP